MQTRSVDYITTNEEHVRMQIFDGDLQISEAAAALLQTEKAQHKSSIFWKDQIIEAQRREIAELRNLIPSNS